jgi:hypothetical protein
MTTKDTQTSNQSDIQEVEVNDQSSIAPQTIDNETNKEPTRILSDQLSNSSKIHWLFACETHKYVRDLINNSDTKAYQYIAFASGLLTYMHTTHKIPTFIAKPLKEWCLLETLCLFGLIFCLIFAILVVFPNLKGSKKGIIFFNSVAEYESYNEYIGDVLKKVDPEITGEYLRHIHELSKICTTKFKRLRVSFCSGIIGLIAALFIMIL